VDTIAAVIAAFLAVAAAVLAVVGVPWPPSAAQRRAGSRLRGLAAPAMAEQTDEHSGRVRGMVLGLGAWVGRLQGQRATALRTRLALAGYRHPSAATYFTGLRLVLTLALAVAVGGLAATKQTWQHMVLWGVAAGAVGYLLPMFVLSRQVARRQRQLRHALPDAIDVMVLSTEGGVSLQAAIDLVAEEITPVHPVLGAELQAVQREIQFGLSPGDAFRALADRCDLPEARDLASAIQQGERYGGGVAKTLRTYSDTARQERQIWAEEMAQKAAVKILFPMLLCIFPAMFIVLLGPAAFQLSKIFAR
jgi:tight adherence protein C